MARGQVGKTVRRTERRLPYGVKSYLCGSAPVQNILLELRDYQRGYEASASPTGVPEEGGVSKGPGRVTSGDCISAYRLR